MGMRAMNHFEGANGGGAFKKHRPSGSADPQTRCYAARLETRRVLSAKRVTFWGPKRQPDYGPAASKAAA